MSTVTAADTLAVLKLLAAGRNIDFVADATGIDAKLVLKFAETHGWPDKTKLAAAATALQEGAATPIPVREPDPPPPRPVAKAPHPVASRSTTNGTVNGSRSVAHTPPIPTSLSTPASRRDDTTALAPSPAVDELVRACRRSESKRTQALGPKLEELVEKVTTALRLERETAEAKAKQAEEFAAKKAQVEKLKKQLADAQAQLRELKPSGVSEAALDFACEVCGDLFTTSQGRGMHRRRSHGQSWSTKHPGAPSE